MNIKLSVIVPVYNSEEFLAKAIESVINQSFKNWELLLIDDGSTDNSGLICDQYAKNDNDFRCNIDGVQGEVYPNIYFKKY